MVHGAVKIAEHQTCSWVPVLIMVWASSQNSGQSSEGAYTASMSILVKSGKVSFKNKVSLLPLVLGFVILHPLFFLRILHIIPLSRVGKPCVV